MELFVSTQDQRNLAVSSLELAFKMWQMLLIFQYIMVSTQDQRNLRFLLLRTISVFLQFTWFYRCQFSR